MKTLLAGISAWVLRLVMSFVLGTCLGLCATAMATGPSIERVAAGVLVTLLGWVLALLWGLAIPGRRACLLWQLGLSGVALTVAFLWPGEKAEPIRVADSASPNEEARP